MKFPLPPRAAVFVVAALIGLAFLARPESPLVEAGPFPDPVQHELSEIPDLPAPEGYRITALASYSLEAMVMSRKRYYLDPQSKISPVDFMFGWNDVTIEPNLSGIDYSQDSRWGNTRFDPRAINLKPREINLSTANTHIIPEVGNAGLRRRMLHVRRGDVVRLSGYLVRVDGPNGWNWVSSLTRRDYGNHACEIFYVTQFD